jgi:RNA-directed DNA polymerase
LEPIFEADFTPNAHGYRPKHSAGQAVREVHEALRAGATDVVDADVSKFFDTIPHAELMRSVARRVSDGRMLHLVKMWLEAPIEESDEAGKKQRRGPGSKGTPQGGVLSPLLANIYMRRFLKAWEERGNEQQLKARVINYADDFVIVCRHTAPQALSEARSILERIGLTLNEAKTRTCNAWQGTFDFLGYTFGVAQSPRNGKPYLAARPSKKSIARLKEKVRELTRPATLRQHPEELVSRLNALLRGWSHYFDYGTLSRSYQVIERHVLARVRRWWGRKFRRRGRRMQWVPASHLYGELGLLSSSRLLALVRGPR